MNRLAFASRFFVMQIEKQGCAVVAEGLCFAVLHQRLIALRVLHAAFNMKQAVCWLGL